MTNDGEGAQRGESKIYNSKIWIQLDTSFLKEYEILGKIKSTTQLSRDNLKLYLKITKPRLC